MTYNPNDRPVEELPVIYGFNNGGSPGWYQGVLLAEDGTCLGGHVCSHESFMPGDLGVLEGSRNDRHEHFRQHYPDGYRMGGWIMNAKMLEVRDVGTFIPVLAVRLGADDPASMYLLGRAGFGFGAEQQRSYVVLVYLAAQQCRHDPYGWLDRGNRTLHVAHLWLLDHFDELEPGAVVDVGHILGETDAPKVPEAASLGRELALLERLDLLDRRSLLSVANRFLVTGELLADQDLAANIAAYLIGKGYSDDAHRWLDQMGAD